MTSVHEWLAEYGRSHTNPTNELIHWICVPLIYWSVYAAISDLPVPTALQGLPVALHWGLLVFLLVQTYYFILSPRLGLGLLLFNVVVIAVTAWLATVSPWPVWQVAAVVFVLAWIGQFIGHMIEGAKPSFFKDIQFLLIGPAWLMGFVFRKLKLSY